MHFPTQSSPSKNVLSPPVDQDSTVDPVQAVRASLSSLRERLGRANITLCSNVVFASSSETALERCDVATLFEILEEMVCDAMADLEQVEACVSSLLNTGERAEVPNV